MSRGGPGLVLLCAAFLFAGGVDAATIVGMSGDVKVKAGAAASWQEAVRGQEVTREAEVRCGPEARCTVAFDTALLNTVTVKENTAVTIEDLEPGRVFLKEGRVFSVIRGVSGEKSFQVRTLTSVSGARGTAWLTDFRDGRTDVSVFEDTVFVNGIDAAGSVTDAIDVPTGQGVSVAADGLPGEVFVVSAEEINEWHGEKMELQALRKAAGLLSEPEKPRAEKTAEVSGEPKKEEGAALGQEEPAAGTATGASPVAAVGLPPMTEEEKLLAEMQGARMETQQALDDTPPAGSDPTMEEDPMVSGDTMGDDLMENDTMGDDRMMSDDSMTDDLMTDDRTTDGRMIDTGLREETFDRDATNPASAPPVDSGGPKT